MKKLTVRKIKQYNALFIEIVENSSIDYNLTSYSGMFNRMLTKSLVINLIFSMNDNRVLGGGIYQEITLQGTAYSTIIMQFNHHKNVLYISNLKTIRPGGSYKAKVDAYIVNFENKTCSLALGLIPLPHKNFSINDEIDSYYEVSLMQKFSPHITPSVLILGSFHQQISPSNYRKVPLIITELADFSLKNNESRFMARFDNNNLTDVFTQIIRPIFKLNQAEIVHRDIKPDNLLVFKQAIKLCDFGTAGYVNEEKKAMTTSTYSSPEIYCEALINHKCINYQYYKSYQNKSLGGKIFNTYFMEIVKYTSNLSVKLINEATDAWATGIIFFKIYSYSNRKVPTMESWKSITNKPLNFYEYLIGKLLNKNPNIRYSTRQAYELLKTFKSPAIQNTPLLSLDNTYPFITTEDLLAKDNINLEYFEYTLPHELNIEDDDTDEVCHSPSYAF